MTRRRDSLAVTAVPDPRGAPSLEQGVRELHENLAALQSLLRQLLEQADEKLAAIRGGETERLHRCAAREADLLEEVARVEQQRRALLARLAQGVPLALTPTAPLSEVLQHFPEPAASILRARSVALRQIATQLQEKNGLVARVAHNLQSHIGAIFAEVASANRESVVYGPKGQHEARYVRSWVDAVG